VPLHRQAALLGWFKRKQKTPSRARDVQDNDLVWVHDSPLLLVLLLLPLFRRYLNDKAKDNEIDWERISPPKPEQVVDYPPRTSTSPRTPSSSSFSSSSSLLSPSSSSSFSTPDVMSFLDLSVRQIEFLNRTYDVNVPFVLMNSFNTDKDTANIIKKYEGHNIDILTFNQSKVLHRQSMTPAWCRDCHRYVLHSQPSSAPYIVLTLHHRAQDRRPARCVRRQ
jgi:UDP-N-acetylglucosamine pyrophosphorylase